MKAIDQKYNLSIGVLVVVVKHDNLIELLSHVQASSNPGPSFISLCIDTRSANAESSRDEKAKVINKQ